MAISDWDAAVFLRPPSRKGLRVIFYRGSAGCQTPHAMENPTKPPDLVANLRSLAHELSNSLETILHAAYLLQEAKLDGKHKKWAQAVDAAARDAARINREIRKILNSES
jgi:nitrogen-specific signal transduction histidine kinase